MSNFVLKDRALSVTTGTGTGGLALSGGTITGYRDFSSLGLAATDLFYYMVSEVDTGGSPLAAWETGVGRYSGGTLYRLIVLESSNADTLVDFAAGTKRVTIGLPAKAGTSIPNIFSAWYSPYLYVRTDGNDSNSGLEDSATGAFATIAAAINFIENSGMKTLGWQSSSAAVTIYVGAGTFSGSFNMVGSPGGPLIKIQGVGNTKTIIDGGSSTIATLNNEGCNLWMASLKLAQSGGGTSLTHMVKALSGAKVRFSGVNFSTCAAAHIYASKRSQVYESYSTISGGATSHISLESSIYELESGTTVTLTNTPAFSTAFLLAKYGSVAVMNLYAGIFVNSASGVRYSIQTNSVCCKTNAVNLPGNSAGTTATGGQYE